jgi:hypothetical protein
MDCLGGIAGGLWADVDQADTGGLPALRSAQQP